MSSSTWYIPRVLFITPEAHEYSYRVSAFLCLFEMSDARLIYLYMESDILSAYIDWAAITAAYSAAGQFFCSSAYQYTVPVLSATS